MKKLHLIGLALMAVFALSAMLASVASAETTLLAEWLNNGAAITSNLASEGKGKLVLEDNKAGLGVVCEGIFDGTVGANGADSITKVLTVGGVEVTLTAPLLCKSHKFCEESTTDIEASPENLPFATKLFLTEAGAIRDEVVSASYSTSCLVLGIKTSEECTAAGASNEVKNVSGGVETVGKTSPNGNCTIGGTGAGELTFEPGNVTKLVTGGPLTVSSE